MSIEQRPEFRAAMIQAEADRRGMPIERVEECQRWRDRIADYIARRVPILINLDDLTDDEPHQ